MEEGTQSLMIDLGCGNGDYTRIYAKACGAREALGVDIDDRSLKQANEKGIQTLKHDLNRPLPFSDNSVSAVVSTQIIEHLNDCDLFASEIFRIMRPRGFAVLATENLACWSNVGSLALGYQPHSENISKIRRIGNPFSGNYGQKPDFSNLHVHVFTYRSFLEFLRLHGFVVESVRCAGYPPIPQRFSGLISRLDPVHTRYITAKVRKPSASSLKAEP